MCLGENSGYPWFVFGVVACPFLPDVNGEFRYAFVREVSYGDVLGGARQSNTPRC